MSGKWNDHDSRNVILEALECYTYFSTWSTCFQAFRYWNDLENTFGICFLHNQSSGIRGKPSFSVVKSGAPGLFSNLYATSGNSTQLGAMWRCSNKPQFLADLLEGLCAARKNDGSNPSPFFWVGISSKSTSKRMVQAPPQGSTWGVHWESENTINTRCFDACHHYVFVLNM